MEQKDTGNRRLAKALYYTGRIALCVLFVLVFSVLYSKFNSVLRNKTSMENISTFYEEPENSIDVIIAGTSHPLFALSPMEMWNSRGIVSYNMCQGGQVLPLTYYCIEEAFRLQNPKIVVLDLYYAIKDFKYGNQQRAHATIDNLQWSPIKLKAILDGTKPSTWGEMFFPMIVYHSRWNELGKSDFTSHTNVRRGAGLTATIVSVPEPEITQTDLVRAMSEYSEDYINRIIALCEKENVPLVFTIVPYSVGNDNDDKTAEEQLSIYNAAKAIAQEHNIPVVDFFEVLDEIDFDFETDMFDATHMNMLGAKKVSVYMADWLMEHYDLEDHREDPAYCERWNKEYKYFLKSKQSITCSRIKKVETITGYFRLLKGQNDLLVLMNLGGEDTGELTDKAVEAMRECGIKTDLRELNGKSWVAVMENGKTVYEESSDKKIQHEDEFGNAKIKLYSFRVGSYFHSLINGKKVGPNKKMLNVVVYSISKKKVIDSVAFDIGKEGCPAVRG